MPFRRRAYIWEEVERRLQKMSDYEDRRKTPALLLVIELLAERIWASLRVFGVCLFFLFIITVGLEIQVQSRNHTIKKVGVAAVQAKTAAEAAQRELEAAINQAQQQGQGQEQTARALQEIHDIKQYLDQLCANSPQC